MAAPVRFRDPVRPVNREFLDGLEIVSNKVFPLPGGVGRRLSSEVDPRLSNLAKLGPTPKGDEIVYYEHIAAVRHRPTNTFYVAFRETMDAFLARQQDMVKYPGWLIADARKQKERAIHIYKVDRQPTALMTSHEQWLSQITDNSAFDAIAHLLAKNNVIDQAALAALG